MIKFLGFLFLVAAAPYAVSASTPRVFLSPMETSTWVLSSDDVLKCEIEHEIPRFGKAVFYQEAGREMRLVIKTHRRYPPNLDVVFRSVKASWQGIQPETEIAQLKTSGSYEFISLDSEHALYAYAELVQGFQPGVFFANPGDSNQQVAALLSTVNFRDVEAEFSACLERLYPEHFDDVREVRVQFDFDEEFPREEEEDRAFAKMLAYMAVDPSVKYLQISGHTDFKGRECYNDTLSARRAWYVYDFLVQSGVEPSRLRVEYFGERYPLKKGKSDAARAANRRVRVTMHK